MKIRLLFSPIVFLSASTLLAQNANPNSESVARQVIDLQASVAQKLASPSHPAQISIVPAPGGTGLDITVLPGPAGFPGVNFTPPAGFFDLSGTGYVEMKVTNTSANIIGPILRVDSPSGNTSGPSYVPPGKSGTARAYYSTPGKGSNPVDPAQVSSILIFLGKNEKETRTFRLESINAGGQPGDKAPAKPELARVKPKEGMIFGSAESFTPAKQLLARQGASAKVTDTRSVEAVFSGKTGEEILIRPALGFWDLSDFLQVAVRVKNTGTTPASVQAQLTSQGGLSDIGTTEKPLAPGATADLIVPFIPRTPFKIIADPAQNILEEKKHWGMEETPGAVFASHQVNGVTLKPLNSTAAKFEILRVTAGMSASDPRPAWLGQSPPVDGEWVKTFEDNFDGNTIDKNRWGLYADNYWDQRVGFSQQNVILGGGLARLKIEKRQGFHNDDPNGRPTEYATGWLETYGKWSQLYGYFEVRVKLPTAPSMFPAFWLMPERGPTDWPKHRRADTKDGGMEIDVFEGQSMWGPYRTTFGTHWDGYGKFHKSAGTFTHYHQPDKDGFLTIGLLWLPGHIAVYSYGRLQGSWDSPRVCSVPGYLIFDMLPGGFECDPLDPATLPAELEIDYVRVWQRKDLLQK